MSGHTHTHTHTYTHTYTHDNYSNPRCAHAHRGLIIVTEHGHEQFLCCLITIGESFTLSRLLLQMVHPC